MISLLMERHWWTTHRFADRGSKLQTQLYVNRQPAALSVGVLGALPALGDREPRLEWVVPLADPSGRGAKPFAEPRGPEMLRPLGIEPLRDELIAFWPARGAVWDALAKIHFPDGTTGALLAEGKNYPREMYSTGTHAGESGSDASKQNRRQIEAAIAWTQMQLGVTVGVDRWLQPLDPKRPSSSLYQTANRLAYLVWLRDRGVNAWFCHLLYLDDPLHQPTGRAAWEKALTRAERELGIDDVIIPYAGHALLPALDPEVELAGLKSAGSG